MGLIRILRIPPHSGAFLFSGPERQTWLEVDWFRDDAIATSVTREIWEQSMHLHIGKKAYFKTPGALLVLGEKWSFTIHYSGKEEGARE